ncbi:MAG: LTA synthase family protein [Bacteroidota bacterium]|nr:LTA synthase family protein [Bacteroidota bacterium]
MDLPGSIGFGWYMDLSAWAYIMVPILLTMIMGSFFSSSILKKVLLYYALVIFIILSGIHSADCELYPNWGYRIDITSFSYLGEVQEAGKFLTLKMILVFLGSFVFHLTLCWWATRKWIHMVPKIYTWPSRIMLLVLLPLLIIPMRGGIGLAPLNPSFVYFSKNFFSNHVALNPAWNLVYTYILKNKPTSSYTFYDNNFALATFDSLFNYDKNARLDFIKSDTPNIIFIILESFTANIIHQSYRGITITPQFNEWTKRGFYYKNTYGSGERTDKGIVAIMSGYPAQPQSSIMLNPSKSDKLPSIPKSLRALNYNCGFYYGGDINFSNLKSYVLSSGFDYIIDKTNFSSTSYNAKWGVHDHIVFEKLAKDIDKLKSPFLVSILTLSSHPPYDIPVVKTWQGMEEEVQFLNAAHYADQGFGNFMEELQKKEIWKNLVVIIVADHGGRFPGNMSYERPEKFKIPMIWTGGAITKDSIIHELVSQTDIASSLLSQLNIPNNDFNFSRNLFSNTYAPFAYYAFNNGLGWLDDDGLNVYSLDKNEIVIQEGNPISKEINIKCFLQVLMDDFHAR